jgi:hypothetical protein
LINIKRLAYAVDAASAKMANEIDPKSIDRTRIVSAVERFLDGHPYSNEEMKRNL